MVSCEVSPFLLHIHIFKFLSPNSSSEPLNTSYENVLGDKILHYLDFFTICLEYLKNTVFEKIVDHIKTVIFKNKKNSNFFKNKL